jgi:hypothetical protein
MNTFEKKIFFEQTIKYVLVFVVIAFLWAPIKLGLLNSSENLEAIAIIMGIISLCALTGYFQFSYSVVPKDPVSRFWGYLCAFLLTIPLILTWLILYFIAVVWAPGMKFIWGMILLSLYLGVLIFDWLDLFRMGRDVAAVNFFEKGHSGKGGDDVSVAIDLLKEGQRLEFATVLVGKAILGIGNEMNDKVLQKEGGWISEHSQASQREVDLRVARAFSRYGKKNKKIQKLLYDLKKGQNQSTADSLISHILELVRKK